jgi:hypothetical protein
MHSMQIGAAFGTNCLIVMDTCSQGTILKVASRVRA